MADLDTKNWQKALRKAFEELMFLTDEEINNVMKELEGMPEKAYKDVFAVVQEGKMKQDEFLKKAITADKEFTNKYKSHFQTEYKKVSEKVTQKESAEADQILNKIN